MFACEVQLLCDNSMLILVRLNKAGWAKIWAQLDLLGIYWASVNSTQHGDQRKTFHIT